MKYNLVIQFFSDGTKRSPSSSATPQSKLNIPNTVSKGQNKFGSTITIKVNGKNRRFKRRMTDEEYASLVKYADKNLKTIKDVTITEDFKAYRYENAKAMLEEVDKTLKAFKTNASDIGMYKISAENYPGAYGFYRPENYGYDANNNVVAVRGFIALPYSEHGYKNAINESTYFNGEKVRNSTKLSTANHEMGHAISYAKIIDWSVKNGYNIKNNFYGDAERSIRNISERIVSKALAKVYPDPANNGRYLLPSGETRTSILGKEISRYGNGNKPQETIAEATRDVMINGKNASKISKAIYKVIMSDDYK